MTNSARRFLVVVPVIGVLALMCWLGVQGHRNPVAIIRVVDSAGKPVAGAVIKPEGLRAKPGAFQSGWYQWSAKRQGVTNAPVRTDRDGLATIPYPKYVFERIETGTLCLSVKHPDFVADRPECVVAIAPPAGAPLMVVVNYYLDRIRRRPGIARTAPIVLKDGGSLRLNVRGDSPGPADMPLFAQVSTMAGADTNAWSRPEPGVLTTRQLPPGPFALRAVKVDTNGTAWFTEIVSKVAQAGQTNFVEVTLRRGATVRGKLDDSVLRPVRNGRVIAHVWPVGLKSADSPPQWHAWAGIGEDGSFEIPSLPSGNLELVALCDGFVSTNGPGQFKMRYPQKHDLGTDDISVVVGMEPTAQLEVLVRDPKGNPLKGARVSTSPNVRYGEWAASVIGSDRYNTAEMFQHKGEGSVRMKTVPPGFSSTTDSDGRALLTNLPPEVNDFTVSHERYALPAIMLPGWSRKDRVVPISLITDGTNRVSVQLEPLDRAPISHF
jgi:hypothetical protein